MIRYSERQQHRFFIGSTVLDDLWCWIGTEMNAMSVLIGFVILYEAVIQNNRDILFSKSDRKSRNERKIIWSIVPALNAPMSASFPAVRSITLISI
jgi:hypothetical protein